LETRGKYIFSIREALDSYFMRNRRLAYKIKSLEVVKLWEKVADEYVKRHTQATVVKDRVLFVHTDSTALANELSLREKELVDSLNKAMHLPIIEKIVFKTGFIGIQKQIIDKKNKIDKKLTVRTLQEIDRTVKEIKEDELRSILKRFLVASAKRNTEE
jgi:hypothetical protein